MGKTWLETWNHLSWPTFQCWFTASSVMEYYRMSQDQSPLLITGDFFTVCSVQFASRKLEIMWWNNQPWSSSMVHNVTSVWALSQETRIQGQPDFPFSSLTQLFFFAWFFFLRRSKLLGVFLHVVIHDPPRYVDRSCARWTCKSGCYGKWLFAQTPLSEAPRFRWGWITRHRGECQLLLGRDDG